MLVAIKSVWERLLPDSIVICLQWVCTRTCTIGLSSRHSAVLEHCQGFLQGHPGCLLLLLLLLCTLQAVLEQLESKGLQRNNITHQHTHLGLHIRDGGDGQDLAAIDVSGTQTDVEHNTTLVQKSSQVLLLQAMNMCMARHTCT